MIAKTIIHCHFVTIMHMNPDMTGVGSTEPGGNLDYALLVEISGDLVEIVPSFQELNELISTMLDKICPGLGL